MNKILFAFKNAVISLMANKFLNCIVVLTLSAGLVLPLILISSVNYDNKTYKQSYYNYIEETMAADCIMEYATQEDLESEFSAKFIKNVAYSVVAHIPTKMDGVSTMISVAGINAEYFDVRRLDLLEGRVITKQEIQSNARVCMVGQKCSNFKLGDTINISGEDFEIVGKIRNPQQYGNIVVPYNFIETLDTKGKTWQYQIYVQVDSPENLNKARMVIHSMQRTEVLVLDKATEVEQNWRTELTKPIKTQFIKSVVLLGFALLTFILIIYSKFLQEKYKFGVKQALGSGQGMFFGEILIQTFLLVQISTAIDMLMAKFIVPHLAGFDWLVDSTFYITAEALCLIISVVVSLILFVLLKRKNVVQILCK